MYNLALEIRLSRYIKPLRVYQMPRGTDEYLTFLDADLAGLCTLKFDSPTFAIIKPCTTYPGKVALKMLLNVESIGDIQHVSMHLVPVRKDSRKILLRSKRQLVDSSRNIYSLDFVSPALRLSGTYVLLPDLAMLVSFQIPSSSLTIVLIPCPAETWIPVIDDKITKIQLPLELTCHSKAPETSTDNHNLPEWQIL